MDTAILPPGFRTRAHQLPQWQPPRWMHVAWITSLALTVLATAICLLGPMDETVLAQGEIRPADYQLVFPLAAGVVNEVAVLPGQRVLAGARMLTLDDQALQRDVAEVQASLTAAQADLAGAEADLAATRESPLPADLWLAAHSVPQRNATVMLQRDLLVRIETLAKSQEVPLTELLRERLNAQQAELELLRSTRANEMLTGVYASSQTAMRSAAVAAAKARCAGLEARKADLTVQLARHQILAPRDGLVLTRTLRFPGERVELGTALFKLAIGDGTTVRLHASEDRVNRLRPGMVVRFRPRSDPDRLAPMGQGHVIAVAPDRSPDSEGSTTLTWAVDVAIDTDNRNLPVGAAVDAEIVLRRRAFWHLLTQRPATGR